VVLKAVVARAKQCDLARGFRRQPRLQWPVARSRSLRPRKGRDAMEKALKIDPGYLDAREGPDPVYQTRSLADRQSNATGGQPPRGTDATAEHSRPPPQNGDSRMTKANEKEYPAAFALCEEVRSAGQNPIIMRPLFSGRTAAVSEQNNIDEHSLERLKRCVTLEPPTTGSPKPSNAWQSIGNIKELLKQSGGARAIV